MNKKKGITLISLVVTIIVLIILAGIVVAVLSDQDRNIVDRSRAARDNMEESQEREILSGILIDLQSLNLPTQNEKIAYIEKSLQDEGITDFSVSASSTTIKSRIYLYSDIPGFNGL